jgi:hypothetical protein
MLGYTSFGRAGPYPKINRTNPDRSPISPGCRVTKTNSGLHAFPQHLPSYPIGSRIQDLRSDFGVEDESLDWLHKAHYGRVPPYLQKVKSVIEEERAQTALPPVTSLHGSSMGSIMSARGRLSPRGYPTAYGIPESFTVAFAGGMVKPPATPRPLVRPLGSLPLPTSLPPLTITPSYQ